MAFLKRGHMPFCALRRGVGVGIGNRFEKLNDKIGVGREVG